MAVERPLEGVNEGDLWKSAIAPPAPEPEPAPPAPPAVPEPTTPLMVKEPHSTATAEPPAPVPPEHIPSWRLKEESDARRQAEDRARILEERLNQIAMRLQQQQEPKKSDFFENPDVAMQQHIARVLQPYAEETRQTLMHMGRMIASSAYGAAKVDEAEEAFLRARETGALDTMDYERVVQSPNRYDAVVQWHRRQNVLSSVGDDPNAWFEKQLEARMADPKFQAVMLEKVRGSAATKPGAIDLPPSLSRQTAATGNSSTPLGDLSDASLWRHATKR